MVAPTDTAPTDTRQRRLAAVVLAGVVCFALAILATALGGQPGEGISFVFFLISLPWTLSVYVLTMVFDLTSPVAIAVSIGLTTLVAWRYLSAFVIRTCVSP